MRRKGVSYARYGYIFCIPFVLTYLVFHLYPLVYTTIIGFTDFKGLGRTDFKFNEDLFENFRSIEQPILLPVIKKHSWNRVANFIPQILLALLLTAWFTSTRRKIKGEGLFK